MQEDLRATLRAGPGEAARRAGAGRKKLAGPAPLAPAADPGGGEGRTTYPVRGGGRVGPSGGLGLPPWCARLGRPEPEYQRQGRRLYRCRRAAARHPATVGALGLDAVG